VEGIPQMINDLVQEIPNAREGFRLLFSTAPFPGFRDASSGFTKRWAATGTGLTSRLWRAGCAWHCLNSLKRLHVKSS